MAGEEIRIVVIVVIALVCMVIGFAKSGYLNKKMEEIEKALDIFEDRADKIIDKHKK